MNVYQEELHHHGILGQKWGRMQGPPYPLGSGDHSAAEKKEGWRKSLGGGRNESLYDRKEKKNSKIHDTIVKSTSKNYQKRFKMTKEEADAEAEKRFETTKKIAIGLGVTAAAATAIYAYRTIGRAYVDDVIKSGTTIQTLQHNPDNIESGKRFYASYRDLDNFKYLGGFGKSQDFFGRPVGNLKKKVLIDSSSDIKIAGKWKAEKAFKELLKDPDFAKAAGTRNYEAFNVNGLLYGPGKEKAANMFFDKLKSQGYGAVRDINDAKRSGFNTKATIIFDKDKLSQTGGVLNKRISDIDPKAYEKARKAFTPMILADSLTNPKNITYGAAIVAGRKMSKFDKEVEKKYGKRKGIQYAKANIK